MPRYGQTKKRFPNRKAFLGFCKRLLFDGVDNLLNEDVERSFVVDSQLGELFSVKLDVEVFESAHKYAVLETSGAARSIDSGNPEAAEFAAAHSAVAVGIFACVFNGVFRVAEEARLVAEIASCRLQCTQSAFARRN